MRPRILISILAVATCLIVLTILLVWHFHAKNSTRVTTAPNTSSATTNGLPTPGADGVTNVYAHNVMLRKGPHFRIYVRWLRGEMIPSSRNIHPSFDQPDSFVLNIMTGDVHVNVGDLNNYLNTGAIASSPLTKIHITGNGNQVKVDGTLHKVIPIPVELVGTIAATPDSRVQLHVVKLSALKIPLKGLLGDFHLKLADLFHPQGVTGIQVVGNDIFFDTEQLFPPPHIRGQLTGVTIVNPDFEAIYGNAAKDVSRTEQWRNFVRLRNGTLEFGKLTMHPVDLVMIDTSSDAWFDLDLTNYQAQLVNGYTRMTPQAGLQIFMPDLDSLPHTPANQNMSVEWLKNRNLAVPTDITSQQKHTGSEHGPG